MLRRSFARKLFDRLFLRARLVEILRSPDLWLSIRAGRGSRIVGPGMLDAAKSATIMDRARLLVPEGARLQIGDRVMVGRDVEIAPAAGHMITIGDDTTIQDRCTILGDVTIGSDCIFSFNIYMSSGAHQFDREPAALVREQDAAAARDRVAGQPIRIGEDCFIGINTVIMPGVEIGRGCVIGSSSVVTKNIPPYTVAAGIPCRALRARLPFSPPEQICATEAADRPYFYAGFRKTDIGLVANGSLVIWLAPSGMRRIELRVRAAGTGATLTDEDGAKYSVGTGWSTVELPADELGRVSVRTSAPIFVEKAKAK